MPRLRSRSYGLPMTDTTCEHGQLRRQCPICERDTRIRELEHKAGQYDTVVAELQVCDGGRHRNDTISALTTRLRRLEKAESRVLKLEAEVAKLRDALEQITPWSQADQDDPAICAMQWRGCVAMAKLALGLLPEAKEKT